ncbi:MAG TPA: DUF6677 family protein [Planctomycetota bacterium]|nr:DUF6677 family protein [Planctomycetota bacterium]
MSLHNSPKGVLLIVGVTSLLVSVFLKKGERIKGAAFLVGWLVPGAGHFLIGQWKKGLFFLLILGATYLFGMWIAGFRPVSFDDNPFYYVGQYGSGMTFLVATLRGDEKAVVRDGIHPSWFDPGLLYVCVVGLLNLVVMLSLLDAKAVSSETAAAPAPPPAPAAGPAPAATPLPEKTA